MHKPKPCLVIFFLFQLSFGYSQTLKGGQFDFGLNNGLKTEWYFNQKISTSLFSSKNKSFSSDTIFLNKDLNADGIPDIEWYLKLNSWRTSDNEEDNSNDIALLTVPFTANNGKSYDGSTVEIYQEFPSIMQVLTDKTSYATKSIEMINAFYRFSKVIPQNSSVRSATSQPLLLQAPINFKEIKSRTAVIQIHFITKIALYKSCDCTKKSEYFYYPCSNDDFTPTSKFNNHWLVYNDNCNQSSSTSTEIAQSCLINWGNEKPFSKSVVEVVLKW